MIYFHVTKRPINYWHKIPNDFSFLYLVELPSSSSLSTTRKEEVDETYLVRQADLIFAAQLSPPFEGLFWFSLTSAALRDSYELKIRP
jgi:hypothetical protein